jgi:hypothetical protein
VHSVLKVLLVDISLSFVTTIIEFEARVFGAIFHGISRRLLKELTGGGSQVSIVARLEGSLL